MTQIASVLAVHIATVLLAYGLPFDGQRRGRICEAKISMQDLEPKVQGGAYN